MPSETPLEKVTAFPDAFTWDISKYLIDTLDTPDLPLYEQWRSPRPSDPSGSVVVLANNVEPKIYEIGRNGPTVECYDIEIWALTKNASPSHGSQERSVLARNIRRLMAGSAELRGILAQNVDESDYGVERFQRLKYLDQRLRSNEVAGEMVFLSITRLEIETETT